MDSVKIMLLVFCKRGISFTFDKDRYALLA